MPWNEVALLFVGRGGDVLCYETPLAVPWGRSAGAVISGPHHKMAAQRTGSSKPAARLVCAAFNLNVRNSSAKQESGGLFP